ncbi:U-box domain-containing protein 9-like [Iris pallida]|uniref:U-box domain-containing protein 9-like n=1 Tax=Iris pallida TaxID=29817 RepID=A0AAX6HUJ9_IRIPA|nr:U-box domain-containing protein 9-like [Iris pallida]
MEPLVDLLEHGSRPRRRTRGRPSSTVHPAREQGSGCGRRSGGRRAASDEAGVAGGRVVGPSRVLSRLSGGGGGAGRGRRGGLPDEDREGEPVRSEQGERDGGLTRYAWTIGGS